MSASSSTINTWAANASILACLRAGALGRVRRALAASGRMRTMYQAWSLLVVALGFQAGASMLTPRDAAPKHLRVATSASAADAAPRAKVSLFVDVTPAPGIHVYAPGA